MKLKLIWMLEQLLKKVVLSRPLLYIALAQCFPWHILWRCGQAWRVCVRLAAQVLGGGALCTRAITATEKNAVGI